MCILYHCCTGAAGAGCKEEIEPDFVPLICLLVGILTLVLLHLVAFLISTSDRYVTKTLKEKTVKKWMSLHQGTASMHAAAVSCDRLHTHTQPPLCPRTFLTPTLISSRRCRRSLSSG